MLVFIEDSDQLVQYICKLIVTVLQSWKMRHIFNIATNDNTLRFLKYKKMFVVLYTILYRSIHCSESIDNVVALKGFTKLPHQLTRVPSSGT